MSHPHSPAAADPRHAALEEEKVLLETPQQQQEEAEPDPSSVVIPTRTVILSANDAANDAANDDDMEQDDDADPTSNNNTATIRLDASEARLFEILRATADQWNAAQQQNSSSNHNAQPLLEIRVAGGWVRDKILQRHTHDVDVAVNRITGVQMAQLVRDYLVEKGNDNNQEETMNAQQQPNVHRIAANPAQSKHLETATMRLFGNLDVDFVHLRGTEVYEAHSRIPTSCIGTPIQDARRRDFTINALFYNLQSGQVEDWTGRGWQDLQAGRIVTPLADAHITLKDDPLRVLRAIRFAVRYQFALDSSLKEAAMHPTIHSALHIKVSRERVGKELEGMLSGKGARPVQALETIAQLKLAGSVFCWPSILGGTGAGASSHRPSILGTGSGGTPACAAIQGTLAHQTLAVHTAAELESAPVRHLRQQGWEEALALLQLLPNVLLDSNHSNNNYNVPSTIRTAVDARMLPLAVFLLPFRDLQCTEVPKQQPNNCLSDGLPQQQQQSPKTFPLVTYMFKEGIKFNGADCKAITTLMRVLDGMVDFLSRLATNNTDDNTDGVSRLQVGLLLRDAKDTWVTALLLATVLQLRRQQQQQQHATDDDTPRTTDWIQVSQTALQTVAAWRLDECWKARPLMDGRAVIATLNLPRGPAVGTFLEEQVRWMLSHPDGTADECRAHLLRVQQQQQGDTAAAAAVVANKRDHRSASLSPPRPEPMVIGLSDGQAPSSPLNSSGKKKKTVQHFSKKMHVESMDTNPD